jgi:hypothetical protein
VKLTIAEKSPEEEPHLEIPAKSPNQMTYEVEVDDDSLIFPNPSVHSAEPFEESHTSAENDDSERTSELESVALKQSKEPVVRPEWIGTSQFQINFAIQSQEKASRYIAIVCEIFR